MIRRPPRSTLFPYTTALPIYQRPGHQRTGLARREVQVGRNGRQHEAQDQQVEAVHGIAHRSEEHTSELQSPCNLVCRLLLEKKKLMRHHQRYVTDIDLIVLIA